MRVVWRCRFDENKEYRPLIDKTYFHELYFNVSPGSVLLLFVLARNKADKSILSLDIFQRASYWTPYTPYFCLRYTLKYLPGRFIPAGRAAARKHIQCPVIRLSFKRTIDLCDQSCSSPTFFTHRVLSSITNPVLENANHILQTKIH